MRRFDFISLIALINMMGPFGLTPLTSELLLGCARAEEVADTTPPENPSLIDGIIPKVAPTSGESPLKITIKNGMDAFKAGSAINEQKNNDLKKMVDRYYRNLPTYSEEIQRKEEDKIKNAQKDLVNLQQKYNELGAVLNVLAAVDKLQDQYEDARIPVKTEGGICKENCTSEKGCRWKKKVPPVADTQ